MPRSSLVTAVRIIVASVYAIVLIVLHGFLPEWASFAGFIAFPVLFVVSVVASAYRYWGKMALISLVSFPIWTGGMLLWHRTGTYFYGGIAFLVIFVPVLYYVFLILEREPPPEMTEEAVAGRRLVTAWWTIMIGLSCLIVGVLFYVLLGEWPFLVMIVGLGVLPIIMALSVVRRTGKRQ